MKFKLPSNLPSRSKSFYEFLWFSIDGKHILDFISCSNATKIEVKKCICSKSKVVQICSQNFIMLKSLNLFAAAMSTLYSVISTTLTWVKAKFWVKKVVSKSLSYNMKCIHTYCMGRFWHNKKVQFCTNSLTLSSK